MRVPRPPAGSSGLALIDPFRASPRRFPDGIGTPTALAKLQTERTYSATGAWVSFMDVSTPLLADWCQTFSENVRVDTANISCRVDLCRGAPLGFFNSTTAPTGLSGAGWNSLASDISYASFNPALSTGWFDYDGNVLVAPSGGYNPYAEILPRNAVGTGGLGSPTPAITRGPQFQLTSMASKWRTTGAGMRVSVTGLPAGQFMAPGTLYLIQVPRDSFSELFPTAGNTGVTNIAPWFGPGAGGDAGYPPPLIDPTTKPPFSESTCIQLVRAGRGRAIPMDSVFRSGGALLTWKPSGPESFLMNDPSHLAAGMGSGPWSYQLALAGGAGAWTYGEITGAGSPFITTANLAVSTVQSFMTPESLSSDDLPAPPDVLFAAYFGISGLTIRIDYVAHKEYVPEVGSAGLVATAIQLPSAAAREAYLAKSAALAAATAGAVGMDGGGSIFGREALREADAAGGAGGPGVLGRVGEWLSGVASGAGLTPGGVGRFTGSLLRGYAGAPLVRSGAGAGGAILSLTDW